MADYKDPYLFSSKHEDGSSLRIVVTGAESVLEACTQARVIINGTLREIAETERRGRLLAPGEVVVT